MLRGEKITLLLDTILSNQSGVYFEWNYNPGTDSECTSEAVFTVNVYTRNSPQQGLQMTYSEEVHSMGVTIPSTSLGNLHPNLVNISVRPLNSSTTCAATPYLMNITSNYSFS